MNLTVYNLLMSLFWSDVCVLLFCLLRRRYAFLRDYGFGPLFCLLALALVRFLIPVELPFTRIIPSYHVLPAIQTALRGTGPLGLSWLEWLGVLWAAGTVVLLLRLLLGILFQRWRIAAMPRGDSTLARQAAAAVMPRGVRWTPTVVVSPSVSVPSVTGFFAPIFLLPELPLTETHLKAVLRHELGHFLGRDIWIKLGISSFHAIFWWNPVVYLLEKDLDYLLEVRADAYANRLRTEVERLDYLEAVTEVVRQMDISPRQRHNYVLSLNMTGQRDQLLERMQLVFSETPRRPRGRVLLAVGLAALLFSSYLFVVQPRVSPPESENYIQIDTSNSYLLLTSEGSYELFINGNYWCTIDQANVEYLLYNSLEIKKES